MKDEIKEILEIARNVEELDLSGKSCISLLDYITNLQKENERLKENAIHNDKVVDKARWNEMIYKSRNEKAIEYGNNCLENIEEYDEYMCESIDIVSLLRMIHKNYLDILQGEDKE